MKSYTHGHIVHVYPLNKEGVPDHILANIPDPLSIWNVFNTNTHVGYLVVFDPNMSLATTRGLTPEIVFSHNHEVEAVKGLALHLFPESNIVTDQKEIDKFIQQLWEDSKRSAGEA